MKLDSKNVLPLFKALANGPRIEIIYAISDSEKSVGELAKITGLGQSAVSQHLGRLRHIGIVTTRRESQTIYYLLNKNMITPGFDYFLTISKGATMPH